MRRCRVINPFRAFGFIYERDEIIDCQEGFFNMMQSYLEEILPDKKPILSEPENPYGRQIYLAEAIHALSNHDVLIKDKYGYIWDYDKIDETFYTYDDNKDTIVITDKYTIKEILELQFDVIPKHKDGSKWIKVKSNSELCSCIVKGKKLRVLNTQSNSVIWMPDKYNDELIDQLYQQYFNERGLKNYVVEYLKEE